MQEIVMVRSGASEAAKYPKGASEPIIDGESDVSQVISRACSHMKHKLEIIKDMSKPNASR